MVLRRWMLVASALAGAACLPSFSGLDDGPANELPPRDGGGQDGSDDDVILPDPDSGVGFDVVVDGDAGPKLPLSCTDARNRGLATLDGDLLIDPDADGPFKPFTVFCKDMSTSPKEYLTLVNTTDPNAANAYSNGTNISGWAMGTTGSFTCTCAPNVVRAFTKVRLDVSKNPLRIVIQDHGYSSSNRPNDQPSACEVNAGSKCQAFGSPATSYGVASSCVEATAILGRANVDLRGTPFHILPTEKGHLSGFQPQGTTTYTTDRKQAEVSGGGGCGYGFASANDVTLGIEQD